MELKPDVLVMPIVWVLAAISIVAVVAARTRASLATLILPYPLADLRAVCLDRKRIRPIGLLAEDWLTQQRLLLPSQIPGFDASPPAAGLIAVRAMMGVC